MTDAQNRQRWAADQRKRAAAKFSEELPPVKDQRTAKLAQLRQMASMMETMPHMADALANVRVEMAKLAQH